MSSNLNIWMNEVNRINNAKQDIINSIANKGINVPENPPLNKVTSMVANLPYSNYNNNNSMIVYNGNKFSGYAYSETGVLYRSFAWQSQRTQIDAAYCGCNITNISQCFSGSSNVFGNHYYNNCTNITNTSSIYYNRDCTKRLNIFANNSCLNSFIDNTSSSIYGEEIEWLTGSDAIGDYYYNATKNTYIYGV